MGCTCSNDYYLSSYLSELVSALMDLDRGGFNVGLYTVHYISLLVHHCCKVLNHLAVYILQNIKDQRSELGS